MNNEQRGGITLNIILILLLVVIAVLIYLLAGDGTPRYGRTIGTDAVPSAMPRYSDNRGTPQPTIASATAEFNDGLGRPGTVTEYPLDEYGAGLASVEVFHHDINNDGRPDRITRRREENGTDHFTYEYTIELNNGDEYVDITPEDFKTIEASECALQKLQFTFTPAFRVIKISRPWQDTWLTPTMATRDTYSVIKNQIHHIDHSDLTTVCDVAELF